ncbi:MAG: CBS domain-containing protein [Cryomorphaceae bacterium]|nr:MAG: CBS domain-containing protein [Cryomorphaceae bacterium]
MKKREPVSKIMTSQLVTLNLTHSLTDAEKMFTKNNIRHIPVVSGDELIGMLSLTDLLRISFVDNFGEGEGEIDTAVYNMLSIDQVMVSKPVAVQSDATIREVAEILATKEFHALPVVEGKKLVGIVTTTDLIKYLLEQY